MFCDPSIPVEYFEEVYHPLNFLAWCTNRSGSKIFSISEKSNHNRDGTVDVILTLNQYDIDYPEFPYARKVLNYLSTLHNPTRSTEIQVLPNYLYQKLEFRMTISDDERVLFIFDMIDNQIHIMHVEDEFFGSANLKYQYSTFCFHINIPLEIIEKGESHFCAMLSSDYYLEAIRNQDVDGVKKRIEMMKKFRNSCV